MDLALSYLTSNSLQDDKYGVVQRDIPRILEALLTFLDVLEGLISQLEKERKDLFANVTRPSTPESDTGGAVDPRIEREEAEWTQVELVYQPLRDGMCLRLLFFFLLWICHHRC